MFKNMLHLKNQLTRSQGALRQSKQLLFQKTMPKRSFSSNFQQPSTPGVGTMIAMGAGTAGLMYLMYHSRTLHQQRMQQAMKLQQMNFFNPIVQQRISKTLAYFGGGLAFTGLMAAALRNSRLAFMNPFLFLAVSFGSLLGTMFTNYQTSPYLKHALWGTFMTVTALGMVPLIGMAGMPIVYDALLATGFTMGGLGLVAYNAPSEQFLMWGGALGMACAGLIGLGFISMFYPSPALYNLYLYGGLLIFSGFCLYDTQKLIFNAKTKPNWDPINESLGIYLDAINLFQIFIQIFMQNKRK